MAPRPDIEAEIHFASVAEGGGPGPYRSRLNTTHDFGHEGALTDAMHIFQDRDEVKPGETVISQMCFLYPEGEKSRLHVGFTFTVQEGRRVIGQGRITKVLNRELQRL
jgi:translation elongation factor EF-Tu-like GTPase